MAQWHKNNQDYLNQERTIHEVYLRADEYGNILNEGACSKSAFGENLAIELTPKIQGDAVYGLDPREFETFTFTASGIATNGDSRFSVSAGSDANSYGVIRSTNFLRYRPGQGAVCRFTASYSDNPVGFTQRAGLFNQEHALQIGYAHTNGQFGVLRANGGKAHIQKFVFTSLPDGNITVTLNGNVFSPAITLNTGTLAGNISQLANGLLTTTTFGGFVSFRALYVLEYTQNSILLLATSLGPQSGTFNLATTGAAIGVTTTTAQTGVTQTENWTFQEDFSIDKLDGTGYSGVTLDPSKLNVYQINFRWLGAGEIRYAIENPKNGDMMFFHHEHYTNKNEFPHIDNPSMKIGYVAANLNNATGVVTCRGASFLGAIEGKVQQTRLPYSATGLRGGAGDNLAQNTLHHVLTVKNKLIYKDKINARELTPKRLTASIRTTGDPSILYIYYNPVLINPLRWQEQTQYNASLFATQDSTGLFSLPAQSIPPIATYHLGEASIINVDLTDIGITIPPNNYISIVIYNPTSAISKFNASLIYVED